MWCVRDDAWRGIVTDAGSVQQGLYSGGRFQSTYSHKCRKGRT